MNSQIVGDCSFDVPQSEVAAIMAFEEGNHEYDEFHYGDWKTFVIWSQSGSDEDGVVADSGLPARLTPRASVLPTLNAWIHETFDVSRLKLVRIHSLGDGVLIPHRDFVEFEKKTRPWIRVHVPLVTNDRCLHSEDDTVFRMRKGEVWFLDASNLHSAINFSSQRRLNLCLDFDLEGAPLETLFRVPGQNFVQSATPELVPRSPLDAGFREELLRRGRNLTSQNFRDVVGWLAKIHFTHEVHIASFFDWMILVAEASGDELLFDKANRFSRFLQHQRSMGERFVL